MRPCVLLLFVALGVLCAAQVNTIRVDGHEYRSYFDGNLVLTANAVLHVRQDSPVVVTGLAEIDGSLEIIASKTTSSLQFFRAQSLLGTFKVSCCVGFVCLVHGLNAFVLLRTSTVCLIVIPTISSSS